MKKLSTLLAVAALSAASFSMNAETVWAMPGTYQDWKLETNLFTDNGDGTWSQTIADFYGDFKVVKYEAGAANWNNEWGTNGSKIENNVAYAAVAGGGNIMLAGDNVHLKNAKVTITPGDDSLTILISSDDVQTGDVVWQMMGEAPFTWQFTTAPKFTNVEGNKWELAVEGSVSAAFKPAKNGAWSNCYSTEGPIAANTDITIATPIDGGNMTPIDGPWKNPTFVILDNGADGIVLRVNVGDTGIKAVEADEVAGEAVYYNLQGQRVANPENGLYIRLQGGKAVKVAL